MKKIFLLLSFFITVVCVAQNTATVTGTIKDQTNQVWSNGTWTAKVYNPSGIPPRYKDGSSVAMNPSGSMDASGVASGVIGITANMVPTGVLWQFNICPNMGVQQNSCVLLPPVSITNTTFNLATYANQFLGATTLPGTMQTFAYGSGNINTNNLQPGTMFWNTSNNTFEIWSGAGWNIIGNPNTVNAVNITNYGAKCDGVTDDSVAIQKAYYAAGSNDFSTIPTIFWQQQNFNAMQGVVSWPYGQTCYFNQSIIVPPGVFTNFNNATALHPFDSIAFDQDYYQITGTHAFYGTAFNGFINGTIIGPGVGSSTTSGIFLRVSTFSYYQNLNIQGFKFGLQGQEVQYSTFVHPYVDNNVVGLYFTARSGASGVNIPVTAYSITSNVATLTAQNGFLPGDTIQLSGFTNGTFFNGKTVTVTSKCLTTCSTFTFAFTNANTSGTETSAIAKSTPALTSIDNHFYDVYSKGNTAYGFWCQVCSAMPINDGDVSGNGHADFVFGAQLDPFLSTAGYSYTAGTGTGCTASTTFPITITGGGGTGAQAYAHTNASGNVDGIWGSDGGQNYTSQPSFSVTGTPCTNPLTGITATIINDSGLGQFDGCSSTSRGGFDVDGIKAEHHTMSNTTPNNGYNGPFSGYSVVFSCPTIRNISFNHYSIQPSTGTGTAPINYMRIARINGLGITFNDPGNPDINLDATCNPGNTDTTICDVSAFKNLQPTGLTTRFSQGTISTTNKLRMVVDSTNEPAMQNGYQATDTFDGTGLHYSLGYRGQGSTIGDTLLEGQLFADTNMRIFEQMNGTRFYGSGTGTYDVGTCRESAGRYAINDGTTCNEHGDLAANNGFFNISVHTPSLVMNSINATGYTGNHSLIQTCNSGGSGTMICAFDGNWYTRYVGNSGISTLVGGTVTINSASACTPSTTCIYKLQNIGAGGTVGNLSVSTIVPGTSFVINSSSPSDTSSIQWTISNQ